MNKSLRMYYESVLVTLLGVTKSRGRLMGDVAVVRAYMRDTRSKG